MYGIRDGGSADLGIKVAPQPETNNYMVLEADSNQMKLSAYLPDGTKFDEEVLRK